MTLAVNSGNSVLDADAAQINKLEQDPNATPHYDAALEQEFAWIKDQLLEVDDGAGRSTAAGNGSPQSHSSSGAGPAEMSGPSTGDGKSGSSGSNSSSGSGSGATPDGSSSSSPATGTGGPDSTHPNSAPPNSTHVDSVAQSAAAAGSVGGPAASATVSGMAPLGPAAAQGAADAAAGASAFAGRSASMFGGRAAGQRAGAEAAQIAADAARTAFNRAGGEAAGQDAAAKISETVARGAQIGGTEVAKSIASAAESGGQDAADAVLAAARTGGAIFAKAVADATRGANTFAKGGEAGIEAGAKAARSASFALTTAGIDGGRAVAIAAETSGAAGAEVVANAASFGGGSLATTIAGAATAGGSAAALSVFETAQAAKRVGGTPGQIADIASQATRAVQNVSGLKDETAAADIADRLNKAAQSAANAELKADYISTLTTQAADAAAARDVQRAQIIADQGEASARLFQYGGQKGHDLVKFFAKQMTVNHASGLADSLIVTQSAANAAQAAFEKAGKGSIGLAAGSAAALTVTEATTLGGTVAAQTTAEVYSVGGTAVQSLEIAEAVGAIEDVHGAGAASDLLHNISTVAGLQGATGDSAMNATAVAVGAYETGSPEVMQQAFDAGNAIAQVDGAGAKDYLSAQITTVQAGELARLKGASTGDITEASWITSTATQQAAGVPGATPADVMKAASQASATALAPQPA